MDKIETTLDVLDIDFTKTKLVKKHIIIITPHMLNTLCYLCGDRFTLFSNYITILTFVPIKFFGIDYCAICTSIVIIIVSIISQFKYRCRKKVKARREAKLEVEFTLEICMIVNLNIIG